ncbi:Uncharacterised protein [Klebsiella pneumoniae]|nr:Uncharacterised protein [Klebsiella pneumoniae]
MKVPFVVNADRDIRGSRRLRAGADMNGDVLSYTLTRLRSSPVHYDHNLLMWIPSPTSCSFFFTS